jgi:uncharacterized protein
MTLVRRFRVLILVAAVLALAAPSDGQTPTPKPKYPNYPSEMPATFKPVRESWDHERRAVMIAMRDGVKLYTVILVPKGAKAAPILFTRTPYDAKALGQARGL